MALRVEHYAIIGDTETAALVGNDRFDRLVCAYRAFDSERYSRHSSVRRHGSWQLVPASPIRAPAGAIGAIR